MKSRNGITSTTGSTGSRNGNRRRGWRFSSPKAITSCQYDTSAVVLMDAPPSSMNSNNNSSTGGSSEHHSNTHGIPVVPSRSSGVDSDDRNIREYLSHISDDVMIRFLRRSLLQAFLNDDLTTALDCYIATRHDVEQHFVDMRNHQLFLHRKLQLDEEKKQILLEGCHSRSKNSKNSITGSKVLGVRNTLKRKGTVVPVGGVSPAFVLDSPSSVVPSQQNDRTTGISSTVIPPDVDASSSERIKCTPGLLQLSMNVCQPFVMDDYYDPYHDPYQCTNPMDNDVDDVTTEDETPADPHAITSLVKEIMSSGTMMTPSSKSFEWNVSNGIDIPAVGAMLTTSETLLHETTGRTNTRTSGNISNIDPLQVTTPIHEVARLGHIELLKCMVQQRMVHTKGSSNVIDLDVRNGYGRTILHNVAGGRVASIERNTRFDTSIDVDTGNNVNEIVGIGSPRHAMNGDVVNEMENEHLSETGINDAMNNESSVAQRSIRMVTGRTSSSRWISLRNHMRSKKSDENDTLSHRHDRNNSLPSFGQCQRQQQQQQQQQNGDHCYRKNVPSSRIDRMETIRFILSWRKGTTSSAALYDTENDNDIVANEDLMLLSPFDVCIGDSFDDRNDISTNAVDMVLNRTALHYAAELGRTDLCEAILSSYYGTLLTIVDTSGRTPCELAALYNHVDLASYLEARSLLYADPYGTEEELLSTISIAEMNHNDVEYYRNNLTAPYCCFETISRTVVEQQRKRIIKEAMEHTNLHVAEFYQEKQKQNVQECVTRGIVDPPADSDSVSISDKNGEEQTLVGAEEQILRVYTVNNNQDFFDTIYDVDESPIIAKHEQPTGSTEMYSTAMEIGIHEGHVEKLLSHHKWLCSDTIAALRKHPSAAFHNAQVPIPQPLLKSTPVLLTCSESMHQHICLICCEEINTSSDKWKQLTGCDHGFCTDCLLDYVTEHTKSASSGFVIECPHHDCLALINPCDIVDVVLPSTETFNRLKRSAIDSFIVSAQDYTYCPYPGCSENNVIHALYPKHVNPSDVAVLRLIGGVCTNVHKQQSGCNDFPDTADSCDEAPLVTTYEGVVDARYYDCFDMTQPLRAHRFCFLCGEKRIHWPVTCSHLQEWRLTIIEHVGEQNINNESGATAGNFNDVAQNIWMKINTRPCPKCKAPIQKDEGCNHITCRNPHCKHQFCWICRADWSTHNVGTGGNYRCNRWIEQKEFEAYDGETVIDTETRARVLADQETDPNAMEETYGTSRHESRVTKKRSSDTARFLHYYERWCGHSDSALLEHKMQLNLCERLAPVVRQAVEYCGSVNIFGGKGLSFLHAAFSELIECRSMLQHSYVFAFTEYKGNALSRKQSHEKNVFEQIQSELELLTEQISDVVARNHMRASETQIAFLTKVASGKRKEFTNFMIDLLRYDEFDMNQKLSTGKTGLPGPRPTIVRSESSDGEDNDDAAEAIRRSLDAYEAANRRNVVGYNVDNVELLDWTCTACTFMNAGTIRRCDMCDTRRE